MIINQQVYDGKFIHDRFAYKVFRKNVSPFGNIVAFRAPMYVAEEGIIDLEDALERDYIYSEDAVNFCWEIPNLDPFGAVSFQRWFNINISTILADITGHSIIIKGDDILVRQQTVSSKDDQPSETLGKASVSITYSTNNVALGHTGINIRAGIKAPSFAFSTNMTEEQITQFMSRVIDMFNTEVKDIWIATSKINL